MNFEGLRFEIVFGWDVFDFDAGWSSPVARWAHNPKVAGSNPAPATTFFEISDLKFEISDLSGV